MWAIPPVNETHHVAQYMLEGGLQDATEGMVKMRASWGKLASFDDPLDHTPRGTPGAFGSSESTPPHSAMRIAHIIVRSHAKTGRLGLGHGHSWHGF